MDQIISKEDWLKQSMFRRSMQILFCKHPHKKAKLIQQVRNRELDSETVYFELDIKQCGVCRQHFICKYSSGYKFRDRTVLGKEGYVR